MKNKITFFAQVQKMHLSPVVGGSAAQGFALPAPGVVVAQLLAMATQLRSHTGHAVTNGA